MDVWRTLIGRPLRSSEASHEEITPVEGLSALSLDALAVITLMNLRGLGEGARAFLLPTIVFIAGMLITIAIGLVHPLDPGVHPWGASLVANHPLEEPRPH